MCEGFSSEHASEETCGTTKVFSPHVLPLRRAEAYPQNQVSLTTVVRRLMQTFGANPPEQEYFRGPTSTGRDGRRLKEPHRHMKAEKRNIRGKERMRESGGSQLFAGPEEPNFGPHERQWAGWICVGVLHAAYRGIKAVLTT